MNIILAFILEFIKLQLKKKEEEKAEISDNDFFTPIKKKSFEMKSIGQNILSNDIKSMQNKMKQFSSFAEERKTATFHERKVSGKI